MYKLSLCVDLPSMIRGGNGSNNTNSNVTVYHILVRIRISSVTNTEHIVESEFLFGYLLNSTQTSYPKI
jgi:hypothetical protein